MKKPTFTFLFSILLQEQEPNLATKKPGFWTGTRVFPKKKTKHCQHNPIPPTYPNWHPDLRVAWVFAFCIPHHILNTKKTTVDVVKLITHGFPSFEIEGVKANLQEEVSIVHY